MWSPFLVLPEGGKTKIAKLQSGFSFTDMDEMINLRISNTNNRFKLKIAGLFI